MPLNDFLRTYVYVCAVSEDFPAKTKENKGQEKMSLLRKKQKTKKHWKFRFCWWLLV